MYVGCLRIGKGVHTQSEGLESPSKMRSPRKWVLEQRQAEGKAVCGLGSKQGWQSSSCLNCTVVLLSYCVGQNSRLGFLSLPTKIGINQKGSNWLVKPRRLLVSGMAGSSSHDATSA